MPAAGPVGDGRMRGDGRTRSRPLLAVLVGALLVACAGSSPAPSAPTAAPTPIASRVDRCGVGLALSARDRGLSSAPMSPAPGELVVDALLVADASGASIEGRPITYVARLRGGAPGLHAPSGQLVFEAERSAAGQPECAGSIRLLLTADTVTRPDRLGTALISATLGGAEVTGGTGPECWALRADDATIGIECSLAGVRRGASATDGILRLRLAWSGTPAAVGALPAWAAALVAAAPTPGALPSLGRAEWTVTSDTPSLTADPTGIGGGSVRITAEGGTVRYRLGLPVVHRPEIRDWRERPGSLNVSISAYTGPGDYAAEAITGTVNVRGDGGWGGTSDIYYVLVDCRATIAAGEAEGRLDCAIGPQPGSRGTDDKPTGRLSATWRTESLGRDVGTAMEVTWRLGDHYVSQGSATVSMSDTSQHVAGIYDVPDVRVGGTPSAPETLRIHIMPFTGDGTYKGDAVLAMLDNVTGDSPRVVATDGRRWPDLWTPLFGACVATIRDAGRSGEITCPGQPPPHEMFRGASTTLTASWRVLP